MTKTQLSQFRTTLEAMEAAVLHRLEVEKAEIVIEKASDFTDDMWSTAGRDVALANLSRDSGLLRNIRAALHRIKKGTFGVCLNCEGTVSQKRLAAVPWTRFCITCQEEMDRNSESASSIQLSTSVPAEDEGEVHVMRSNP